MERLKSMKESLMSCVQSQMGDLKNVDAKELGEAIDMIKDLEEAIYYATITKSMHENEHKEKEIERHYYTERPYYPPMYNPNDYNRYNMPEYYGGRNGDSNRYNDTSYYNGSGGNSTGGGNSGGNSGGSSYYTETSYTNGRDMMRDRREGRSGSSRRGYMEAKEMKKGTAMQMKELEKYIQELSSDIVEMVGDASPEEKNLLKQHLHTISEKIK